MKASPLLIQWHNGQTPIYSAHFQPHGKGRLATGGGDNNVRLWKIESNKESRIVSYLSTLAKHNQAVNVVRWSPSKEDILASAGDDGNVLVWVPAERHDATAVFGADLPENKETWRVRHMCRSMGSEIYDLAWSPDGLYFLTGSMDNIVRIYNAHDGSMVRQIAEHNHYVQGVAWDPLNEFIATQSSDRSVHIYALRTKDGHFSLNQFNKISKADLPIRTLPAHSPTPPDLASTTTRRSGERDMGSLTATSPVLSTPGTPSSSHPMPTVSIARSRRSSHSSSRRSVSPAPSFPLPAVMPSVSPGMHPAVIRNANLYANETYTSFFRRLTFSPDGSLLFTPAGQYRLAAQSGPECSRQNDEVLNTVYIYSRAGLNRPPVAYLPGHKKASIAVRCSPVLYNLRMNTQPTRTVSIDTSAGSAVDNDVPVLPDAALSGGSKSATPLSCSESGAPSPRSVPAESTAEAAGEMPAGPTPVFGLGYRIVYAVAAHDTVYVYDTQQRRPLCVVSNLHYSAFTDLAWTSDGTTLLISSSDGFCSVLAFGPDELGTPYSSRPTPAPSVASSVAPSGAAIVSGPASMAPSVSIPASSGAVVSSVGTAGQTTLPALFSNIAPPGRLTTPIPSSVSVSSRQSRPSTPSTSISSSSARKDTRDVTAPVSPSTSISTVGTDICGPPGWGPSPASHILGNAIVPASATPTLANLPSVAAAQSGSLSSFCRDGSLVPTGPAGTPPMTPRRTGGSVIMPGSRHRTHSASSSISGFDISGLPAPPLFQADSGSVMSSSTPSALLTAVGSIIPSTEPSEVGNPSSGGARSTDAGVRKRPSETLQLSIPVVHLDGDGPGETTGQKSKRRRLAPTPVVDSSDDTS